MIAFIDVMGFGALVDASINDEISNEIIKRISDAILSSQESLEEPYASYQFTQFSDSFVISRPVKASPVDQAHFTLAVLNVIDEFLISELLLRGGITQGKLIHNDKLLFGPAMNRAYELESKVAKVPRIILDPNLDFASDEFRISIIKRDIDGLDYIDYFFPRKVFYLVPGWLLQIRNIINSIPESPRLKDKRNWLISKYNKAIDDFSYIDFENHLKEKAEDRPDIAEDYEKLIFDAKSLDKIKCMSNQPNSADTKKSCS